MALTHNTPTTTEGAALKNLYLKPKANTRKKALGAALTKVSKPKQDPKKTYRHVATDWKG